MKEAQEKQDQELVQSVFYNSEGQTVKRVLEPDPLVQLKNQRILHSPKRKVDANPFLDLGIIKKNKQSSVNSSIKIATNSTKNVESSLELLGSMYQASSSDSE